MASTNSVQAGGGRVIYIPGNPAAPSPGIPPVDQQGFVAMFSHAFPDQARRMPRSVHSVASIQMGAANDWYMNQIWIAPKVVDFGNIITEQTRTLVILNTYRSGIRTLAPLDLEVLDAAGVTMQSGVTFPMPLYFFEQREIDFTAAVAGPPTFGEFVEFDFDILNLVIQFVGSRLIMWPFLPDWSTAVTERLQWLTDRLPSISAVRQRRAMRLSPRRTFRAKFLLDGAERSQFNLAVIGWRTNPWVLPIWHDIQLITEDVAPGAMSIPCITAGRDFRVGGLAVLRGQSAVGAEAIEIESIESDSIELVGPTTSAWPRGSRLYPSRIARLAVPPDASRLTDRAIRADVEFIVSEANDWPAATLPQYRGFGVYDARPDESEDLSQTHEWLSKALDNLTGLPFVLDTAGIGLPTQMHRWVLHSLTEHAQWRSLIYALRGAQVPVWVPTHAEDIRLVDVLPGGTVTMTIEWIGYARFGLNQPSRCNLRIELTDGSVYYRRIANAAEVDDETEEVVIDEPLPETITPAQVWRISFMALCTGEDAIEINHITDAQGVSTSRMVFTAERDDG